MFFSIILYTVLTGLLFNIYEVTTFKNINVNKKLELKYKQVNYVKGITLGLFSPYTIYIIYSILFNNIIPTYTLLGLHSEHFQNIYRQLSQRQPKNEQFHELKYVPIYVTSTVDQ